MNFLLIWIVPSIYLPAIKNRLKELGFRAEFFNGLFRLSGRYIYL